MANHRFVASSFDHLKVFCGSPTIAHYTDPSFAPLVIGKERFSYTEIATRTGLPAGRTARLITDIAAGHRATSIRDFYDKSSPSSLAVHGFGSGSLLMVFRLFESEGLDVIAWARRGDAWKNPEDGKDAFTTWTTYKHRESAAEARTVKQPAGGPREKGYRKKAVRDQKRSDRRSGIG